MTTDQICADVAQSGEDRGAASVSVVVCAYTEARWHDLCATIESLLAQVPKPDEIILVIDNNDGLLSRARGHFGCVKVVPNRLGQGLSAARNTGLAESIGSLIAFIDDDATLAPDVIARLASATLKPEVLGATANILPDWVGRRPSWFPDEYLWTVGCTYERTAGSVVSVRNVTGAACMIRREVFVACGAFSQALGRRNTGVPVSCEETELCFRARMRFKEQGFVRDDGALVHHKVPAARLTWHYFLIRCYAEGLSKGRLRSLLLRGAPLQVERNYVTHDLAPAAARAVWTGVTKQDAGALARAAAIVLGLAAATLGYAGARLGSIGESLRRITPRRMPSVSS